MRALVQALERRLEEVAQGDQLLDAGEAAGVEHQRLELRPMLGGPARQAEVVLAVGEGLVGEARVERAHRVGQRAVAADQQGAVHRAAAAGLPAFQAHRGGQAEGAKQAAAGGGVGEGEVAVGHGTGSRRWARRV
ncbi:hypothetical protein D9M69_465270 [compost metagenome]